jgi:hypothetical protein
MIQGQSSHLGQKEIVEIESACRWHSDGKTQVPPLRYASVGMTIYSPPLKPTRSTSLRVGLNGAPSLHSHFDFASGGLEWGTRRP